MPKAVDSSVTSKEVGSGNNQTNMSGSVGVAIDGLGMTPPSVGGPRKTSLDEKLDKLKATFRE